MNADTKAALAAAYDLSVPAWFDGHAGEDDQFDRYVRGQHELVIPGLWSRFNPEWTHATRLYRRAILLGVCEVCGAVATHLPDDHAPGWHPHLRAMTHTASERFPDGCPGRRVAMDWYRWRFEVMPSRRVIEDPLEVPV